MDQHAFKAQLEADGYTEIESKDLAPKPANAEHGHHFTVRGLVLAGAFIVRHDNRSVTYGPGEVFTVAQGVAHCEEVGPDGARVIVGRKY